MGERFNLDAINTDEFGADWTDLRINQQLDIIGEIVGARRVVNFEPSEGVSPTLDNKTFLLLIKAKIANNHWDGLIDSLQPLWKQIFPDGSIIVVDNQDMTVDVYLTGSFTSIIVDLIQHDYIVPRPQGVLINYHFGTFPFLGFDLQNQYIAGFDTGYWT